MIRFCTLFSSSSGNCTFISDGDTNILVDVGVSAARTVRALGEIGVSPEEIDAVLVTHEHSDHISGIRVLCTKYSIPVYANGRTMAFVKRSAPCLSDSLIKVSDSGSSFNLRSAKIHSFRTPHDSAESVGYVVEMDGKRFGITTDTGCVTDEMVEALTGCRAALIESNHDIEMLKCGAYPYVLKRRILSSAGHLSNNSGALLALHLAKNGTVGIGLGHLSDQNNTYEKAYCASEDLLCKNGIVPGSDVRLCVCKKDSICEIYSE